MSLFPGKSFKINMLRTGLLIRAEMRLAPLVRSQVPLIVAISGLEVPSAQQGHNTDTSAAAVKAAKQPGLDCFWGTGSIRFFWKKCFRKRGLLAAAARAIAVAHEVGGVVWRPRGYLVRALWRPSPSR